MEESSLEELGFNTGSVAALEVKKDRHRNVIGHNLKTELSRLNRIPSKNNQKKKERDDANFLRWEPDSPANSLEGASIPFSLSAARVFIAPTAAFTAASNDPYFHQNVQKLPDRDIINEHWAYELLAGREIA